MLCPPGAQSSTRYYKSLLQTVTTGDKIEANSPAPLRWTLFPSYGRVFYFAAYERAHAYSKPWLSLPNQLALLKRRGLLVQDDAASIECLHRNGYYRLSAYWYPFREIAAGQRTDLFLPDSRFEDARNLYVFDKEFKLHLLDALERVEIAVRVEAAMGFPVNWQNESLWK